MYRTNFLRSVVVVVASLVGIGLGNLCTNVVKAQGKARRNSSRLNSVSTRSTLAPCPTITVPSFTLSTQDDSTNEGLAAADHSGFDGATVYFQVAGLPPRTSANAVFTFELSYKHVAATRSDANPERSGSMALSYVSVFLGAAGQQFLKIGDMLTSQGGVSHQSTPPLPSGTIQFTAPVSNGQSFVTGNVQASARTSQISANASSFVVLDLVDISFVNPPAANAVAKSSGPRTNGFFNRCPDCSEVTRKIDKRIADMIARYDEMLKDPANLYCKAREVRP